jgi:hypothetical protein
LLIRITVTQNDLKESDFFLKKLADSGGRTRVINRFQLKNDRCHVHLRGAPAGSSMYMFSPVYKAADGPTRRSGQCKDSDLPVGFVSGAAIAPLFDMRNFSTRQRKYGRLVGRSPYLSGET